MSYEKARLSHMEMICSWMLDVGCWLLGVGRWALKRHRTKGLAKVAKHFSSAATTRAKGIPSTSEYDILLFCGPFLTTYLRYASNDLVQNIREIRARIGL